MKYVLVSGGVISGVGKGIIASSTGLLLKTIGLTVTAIKIDPYLNVDAGTMNPKEHGEVFTLDDGGEVDLDLGNYERYLNITLTRENNITTGKIYQKVVDRERQGDYLGKTVQVVPHITNTILEWIQRVALIPVDETKQIPDVCIIELGGTIGDIESGPFVEALSGLQLLVGRHNFFHISVPYIFVVHGEQKTKPAQNAARSVRSVGLSPNMMACRCAVKLEPSIIDKIATNCFIDKKQVIEVRDMPSTYLVPGLLKEQNLIPILSKSLCLDRVIEQKVSEPMAFRGQKLWAEWDKLVKETATNWIPVTIALVGKYTNSPDAYLSVVKSLEHSAMRCGKNLNLFRIDSEHLEEPTKDAHPEDYSHAWQHLTNANGVLVPGGFGIRATEGMIRAANYARVNKIPYLGICLGLQIAVIEYARNVCGVEHATSEEFATTEVAASDNSALNVPEAAPDVGSASGQKQLTDSNNLIVFMPEIDRVNLGGTMRLGRRATHFQDKYPWSRLRPLYGKNSSGIVYERHRHRYEVNPGWVDRLETAGLCFTGKDEEGTRMEILEIKDHPWYVAVQYHPEYLSRVLKPSPPYLGFVAAAASILDTVTKAALDRELAKDESQTF